LRLTSTASARNRPARVTSLVACSSLGGQCAWDYPKLASVDRSASVPACSCSSVTIITPFSYNCISAPAVEVREEERLCRCPLLTFLKVAQEPFADGGLLAPERQRSCSWQLHWFLQLVASVQRLKAHRRKHPSRHPQLLNLTREQLRRRLLLRSPPLFPRCRTSWE